MSVSGGLFFKRRTTFIGDGRILLEPAWIRGGEDEEVLEWRQVTVVRFTRLITFKDGRLFKKAVVLF